MKEFKLKENEIKELTTVSSGCIASDRITVDGEKVGYMYRENPTSESDSGWRFFSGDETEEYTNNFENFSIFQLNTICNYDNDIIPFLESKVGTKLARNSEGAFIEE